MSNDKLQWMGVGLLGLTFVLALVIQFVPWYSFEQTMDSESAFGGFQFTGDLTLWEIDVGGDSEKWSDSAFDDVDSIGEIRAGGPLVLTGLILSFLAAVAFVLVGFVKGVPMNWIGVGAAFIAMVLLVVGFSLYASGADELLDDMEAGSGFSGGSFDESMGAGFIIGIIALVTSAGGLILAAVPTLKGLRSSE